MNLDRTETPANDFPLELVRYRIIGKPYRAWRAIFAQTGQSDTALLVALRDVHSLYINKDADPMLYITQDTQQMRLLEETANGEPIAMLQIMLTTKVFAKSEEEAKEKIEKILRGTPDPEIVQS